MVNCSNSFFFLASNMETFLITGVFEEANKSCKPTENESVNLISGCFVFVEMFETSQNCLVSKAWTGTDFNSSDIYGE